MLFKKRDKLLAIRPKILFLLTIFLLLFIAGCANINNDDFGATDRFETSPPSQPEIPLEKPKNVEKNLPLATLKKPPTEKISEKQEIRETDPRTISIIKIKDKLDYQVPFSPQAPFGNWDLPYQEACEEASAIMAARYFMGQSLDNTIMNEEILKLVLWQKKYFGYYEDTTAKETAQIIREYFGLKAEVSSDVSVENIKKELNRGKLIIIPASGRELNNPYFSGEGPFYHMLIIRGYDRDKFITNDPGTKRGEGFEYTYDSLINAVHDWTGSKEKINQGAKVMIVVSK